MIDVPDRPNVYVRLAAIKFFLAHDVSLSSRYRKRSLLHNSSPDLVAGQLTRLDSGSRVFSCI
jgi:hypothetical protein